MMAKHVKDWMQGVREKSEGRRPGLYDRRRVRKGVGEAQAAYDAVAAKAVVTDVVENIVLSAEDFDRFLGVIGNPPSPTPELVALMNRRPN